VAGRAPACVEHKLSPPRIAALLESRRLCAADGEDRTGQPPDQAKARDGQGKECEEEALHKVFLKRTSLRAEVEAIQSQNWGLWMAHASGAMTR